FIPPIFDRSVLDRKFLVNSSDSLRATRELTEKAGAFPGISSGAVLSVGQRVAAEIERGDIVCLLPDGGWKYLSTEAWAAELEQAEKSVSETLWWWPMPQSPPLGGLAPGLGALTVPRAILALLPYEPIVYVGDTARFPYGPKQLSEIRTYALEIADYLVSRDVKILVVVWNSIGVAAIRDVTDAAILPVVGERD